MVKSMVVSGAAWAVGCIVGVAACGGHPNGNGGIDAMGEMDGGGKSDAMPPDAIAPGAMHHGYVVSRMFVPTNDSQALAYGLDLGGSTSSTLDGTVDNALGKFFSAVSSISADIDLQGAIDTAVDHGSLLLLLDLETTGFLDASVARLGEQLGSNPVPAACDGAADTTCRHHLTGTASFSIASDSPAVAAVSGAIVAGTFNGGPGTLVLPMAIDGTTPIKLNLLHGRIQASSISADGIATMNVGGLVGLDEVVSKIISAVQARFQAILLDSGCTPSGAPTCGCTAGSTGAMLLTEFDGDITGTTRDCVITNLEIMGSPRLKPLLKLDSCALDSCAAADTLSVGVQVQAARATFPM